MASEDDSKRGCFTFIWKLENASYCWQRSEEYIRSPSFSVDEINLTDWNLEINPSIEKNRLGFCLRRQESGIESVKINCDVAFVSSDGAVLKLAFERKNKEIRKGGCVWDYNVACWSELFSKRSVFLPQDILTVRCRIWNSVLEMSKNVKCVARTHIVVEKRSFLWSIKNFNSLESHEKRTYQVQSNNNSKYCMSLELFSAGGMLYDETFRFKIIPNYQNIKKSTFQLSVVDASKATVKCFQDEFWCGDHCGSKDFTLFCTKRELLEKKSAYLPNDVLSLLCECTFCFGNVQEEIEEVDSACIAVGRRNSNNFKLDKEKELPVPKCILLDNLKSIFNSSCVSDVKLKTKSQVYPAHKSILSARSPVFMSMFSNDMREKINECVDIEDLNDSTVLHMLRYIYTAEVHELDWESASKLYEASDKYQILSLKDICSSYLKSNLRGKNACEALVLADMHQDEDLKGFVQDFILRHGEDIINSEEWDQLAESNLKLAYETTCRKFKK